MADLKTLLGITKANVKTINGKAIANVKTWDGLSLVSSTTYLLDTYTGAVAAWSIRQLKSGVTNCIRIRRSSDNTEQDIGFSSGYLDTSSITSFVGSNSAYIVTWYDQSGNANNWGQSTASKQPRIVNAGTLEVIDSIAALKFDGSDDKLDAGTQIGAAIGLSVFMTGKRRTTGVFGQILGTNNTSTYSPFLVFPYSDNTYRYTVDQGYSSSSSSYAIANHELNTLLYPASNTVTVYADGSAIPFSSFNSLSNTTDFTEIGARSANSEYTDGHIQEIILYSSDQTSNKGGIETNIRDYYSLYLLDIYTGASVAYSVRKLKSGITNCMRIRRSSDNSEQDIGFVNGYLDTASITSFVGSNDAFVVTWYDQSGNSNNLTQSTASQQPKIVSSGTIITDGSKASMTFDGSNDYMSLGSALTISGAFTSFSVAKRTSSGGLGVALITSNGNGRGYTPYRYSDNYLYCHNVPGVIYSNTGGTSTSQELLTGYMDGSSVSSSDLYVNGSILSGRGQVTQSGATTLDNLGYRSSASEYAAGNIQELIVYTSLNSNRAAIDTAIKSYYGL